MVVGLRHPEHVLGELADDLVAVGGHRDDVGAARADLLDVADQLGEDGPVVGDDHDGRLVVEQRDGAVLHLAGGVGLGRDVADLLELERALEADGEAHAAAEVEEEALVVVPLGDLLDGARAGEELLGELGHLRAARGRAVLSSGSVMEPRAHASRSAMSSRAATWLVCVLVAATPISRPARV